MSGLNQEQRAAVQYIDGPLLVLAGAGSGKTRVITQKIAYLIRECAYKANTIIALTFTNKAAQEMLARVAEILPAKIRRGLTISTFHTLGLNILKAEAVAAGLKPGFSIFDDQDSLTLIRSLLQKNTHRDQELLNAIQQQLSKWKNALLTPLQVMQQAWEFPFQEAAARIYQQYQQHLRAYNAVDFDDLILRPLELLQQQTTILEKWQNKLLYLLIDEYQDTNASQYLLIKLLTGVRGAFTVVGDDDQSIYAWRGAQPENLNLLQQDFPQLRVIKLEQNYRSTTCILESANHLIANNPHLFEKKLWSALGYGAKLQVITAKDEFDEAEQVATILLNHQLVQQSQFKDYALLYRGNHQSRLFETALRQHNIPYKISGGQSFFARTEIKDIVAYCRLLYNSADDNAFLRIINTPRRGIGASTLEKLAKYSNVRQVSLFQACSELGLAQHLSANAVDKLRTFAQWLQAIATQCERGEFMTHLKMLIEDINYEAYLQESCETSVQAERRMANVWDLLFWMENLLNKAVEKSEKSLTLSDVIARLLLFDILDRNDNNTLDQVQLMTLHAAKGLEFPYVFLVGMEEQLLPHRTSIEEDNIAEERRLAYVGITRAQRALWFSMAQQRHRYGEQYDCEPSRFLEELPVEHLVWSGVTPTLNSAPEPPKTARQHLDALKELLSN